MDRIINQIEANRILLGINKRALCKAAEISVEYYRQIISSQAPGCAYAIIEALATHVGIILDWRISPELLNRIKNA